MAPRASPSEARVAFLFLAREGLHAEALWADFFAAAPAHRFAIFAHTKAPPPPSSLLSRARIAEIVPTEWGTISLVRATLALLRAALRDEAATHFVLLSESCVPLYAFDHIYAELAADGRAWIAHAPTPPWMIHQKGPTREFVRWSPRLAPIVPSPDVLLKQQQWMVLSRDLAALHTRVDHSALWDDGLFAPDEHYFINATIHELRQQRGGARAAASAGVERALDALVRNRKLTHVEWGVVGNGRAPLKLSTVSTELVERARGEGCLFLRKVAPGAELGELRAAWARS